MAAAAVTCFCCSFEPINYAITHYVTPTRHWCHPSGSCRRWPLAKSNWTWPYCVWAAMAALNHTADYSWANHCAYRWHRCCRVPAAAAPVSNWDHANGSATNHNRRAHPDRTDAISSLNWTAWPASRVTSDCDRDERNSWNWNRFRRPPNCWPPIWCDLCVYRYRWQRRRPPSAEQPYDWCPVPLCSPRRSRCVTTMNSNAPSHRSCSEMIYGFHGSSVCDWSLARRVASCPTRCDSSRWASHDAALIRPAPDLWASTDSGRCGTDEMLPGPIFRHHPPVCLSGLVIFSEIGACNDKQICVWLKCDLECSIIIDWA